ncbi:MAG: MFS transporter, partial [Candidatus Dormiibacterota bacterium]
RTRALVALRHRNFRLYMPGQALSMIGISILSLALPWVVFTKTHTVLWVGLALTLQYLPLLGGSPFAEVLLRTVSRRRLLVGTHTLCCGIGFALALLAWLGAEPLWALLLLSLLWGAVQACEAPTRQHFLVDMVGRHDLTYAISLTASAWNAAAIVGAAVAGLLLVMVGAWAAFAAVGAGVLAGAFGLLLLTDLPILVRDAPSRARPRAVWRGVSAHPSPAALALILLGCTFSALGMNRLTLVPALAGGLLGSGAAGFAISMVGLGLGAAVGTVALLWQGSFLLERRSLWFAAGWAVAMVLFGWSRWTWASAVLLGCSGLFQTWFLASVSHRLQRIVPDPARGTTLTLYAWCVVATAALGPLQAALLGWAVGVPITITIDAIAVTAVAIAVGVRWKRSVAKPTDQISSNAAP